MALRPQMLAQPTDQLYAKVKRLCVRRGGDLGLLLLARQFGTLDCDADYHLPPDSFFGALSTAGIQLSDQEKDTLKRTFTDVTNGEMGVLEFLTALRTSLDPKRLTRIAKAWDCLPKQPNGRVLLDDLLGTFNPAGHPLVLQGSTTEDQLSTSLQAAFNSDTNPSGSVPRIEFESYYSAVSANIDNDEMFALIMTNVWGGQMRHTMGSTGTFSAGCRSDGVAKLPGEMSLADKEELTRTMYIKEESDTILHRLRDHLVKTQGGVASIGRVVRAMDTDMSGSLSRGEFMAGVSEAQLPMSDGELEILFDFLDSDGDGRVDYGEFMACLRPPLPPRRKRMVELCWSTLPEDSRGHVTLQDLIGRFRVAKHPLVSSGQKTAEEINMEFVSAFEYAAGRANQVSYEEFEEYFADISTSLPNDRHFELMMKSNWGLNQS